MGGGWGGDVILPLSYVIAHEIGHALGLTNHWDGDKGVMDTDANFTSDDDLYGSYNYFDDDDSQFQYGRLDGQWNNTFHNNAVNTRKVIGIQTIDFKN